MTEETITKIQTTPGFVKEALSVFGSTISGHNPFHYLDDYE